MGDSPRGGPTAGSIAEDGRRFSWWRTAVRLGVALLVVVAVDVALARLAPEPDYDDAYRLPRTSPAASLPGLVRHIEHVEGAGDTVVFLGSSPTYGPAPVDRESTWPEAYETAAFQAGYDVRVFNLACDGQLLADQRVIAERLADDVGIVFVQLDYDAFDPAAEAPRIGFAELPRLLGVSLPAEDVRQAGIASTRTVTPLSAAIERELRDRWALYRRREWICERVFGGSPAEALRLGGRLPEKRETPLAEARRAGRVSFVLEPTDPQVRLLRGLARTLQQRHIRAVFYLPPTGRAAAEPKGTPEAERYERNVGLLRDVVEREGFMLLDYDRDRPRMPASMFADAGRLTAEGSRQFGRRLFDETRAYVFGNSLAWRTDGTREAVSVR